MKNRYDDVLDIKYVKQKIQESIKRSRETNKEYGFDFFIDNGKIVTTDIIEGEKNSLESRNRYSKGIKVVGNFHVHTRLTDNDVVPSPGDIKKGVTENFDFFCIGASLDDHEIIRCFTKNDLEKEMKEIFQELESGRGKEGIDKSSKLIARKMATDKDYLDEHSHKRTHKIR